MVARLSTWIVHIYSSYVTHVWWYIAGISAVCTTDVILVLMYSLWGLRGAFWHAVHLCEFHIPAAVAPKWHGLPRLTGPLITVHCEPQPCMQIVMLSLNYATHSLQAPRWSWTTATACWWGRAADMHLSHSGMRRRAQITHIRYCTSFRHRHTEAVNSKVLLEPHSRPTDRRWSPFLSLSDNSLDYETTSTGTLHRAVCLFTRSIPGSFCCYCTCPPRSDGQTELTCMSAYILRWFTRP